MSSTNPNKSTQLEANRLRRRRSPPRLGSISSGIGSDTPMKTKKPLARTQLRPKRGKSKNAIPRPVILNTVTMRPEFKTELPPSSRTTVLTLPERDTSPRISVPRRRANKAEGLDSKVHIVASQGSVIRSKNIGGSTTQQTKRSGIREATVNLRGKGLELIAGETHLWKLTNNGVPKSRKGKQDNLPKLSVDGDQGVRISFMSMMGDVIQDLDIPPHTQPTKLPVPPGTRLVAAIGLGGADMIPDYLNVCAGGVLTELSTKNSTGIGFQPTSTLIQLGPLTYLCRGAQLRLKTIYSGLARGNQQAFTAMNVLQRQSELKFTVPSTIDNLVIILSGQGDAEEALSVEMGGLQVNGKPHLIKRAESMAYIWDVTDEVKDVNMVQITAQVASGWSVQSMAGVKGSYENWLSRLTSGSWSGLVEEGPLSPEGQSTLIWTPAPPSSERNQSRLDSDRRDIPSQASMPKITGALQVKPGKRLDSKRSRAKPVPSKSKDSKRKKSPKRSSAKKQKGRR
ncbi:MAG: hypothetical protein CXX81_07535 [Methanobacteriota archaeon]|nr:MAG: hypothetical protein CXX81_07535 [Euryarchaeota archaeon]